MDDSRLFFYCEWLFVDIIFSLMIIPAALVAKDYPLLVLSGVHAFVLVVLWSLHVCDRQMSLEQRRQAKREVCKEKLWAKGGILGIDFLFFLLMIGWETACCITAGGLDKFHILFFGMFGFLFSIMFMRCCFLLRDIMNYRKQGKKYKHSVFRFHWLKKGPSTYKDKKCNHSELRSHFSEDGTCAYGNLREE